MDKIRNCMFICLICALTTMNVEAQVYRCSKNPKEACVFPFEDEGETYNECKKGWRGSWCETDGSYGWAYCDICPEDLTSTTTTTTTSTTTTTTTTPIPSTTTSTVAPTTTTATTSELPTTSTLSPTTTTSTEPTTITSIPSTTSTTTVPTATSSTLKPAIGLAADGGETTELSENEDEAISTTKQELPVDDDDSTTQGSAENDQSSTTRQEDAVVAQTTSSTPVVEKTTESVDGAASTTTKAPAKVCTYYGNTCKFPFEYNGVIYNECVEHAFKRYGWCYIDDQKNYEDCYLCKEEDTTSTQATTVIKSSQPLTSPRAPIGRAPVENQPTTKKQSLETTAPYEPPLSSPEGAVSSTRRASTTGAKSQDAETTVEGMQDKVTTKVLQKESQTGEPKEDMSGPGKVAIIIVVLSILAVLVIFAIIVLYIRKLRRSKKAGEEDKNGGVGESGEGLLSHNKNGNHKTANDGNSQEMQPLNTKKENGGGDCDVINEKVTSLSNGTAEVIA